MSVTIFVSRGTLHLDSLTLAQIKISYLEADGVKQTVFAPLLLMDRFVFVCVPAHLWDGVTKECVG